MDENIRRSIRNLGFGFHAGQFSTRQLLELLQIRVVYIVSGIIEGVFFSAPEIVAYAARQAELGHFIDPAILGQIAAWARETSSQYLTIISPDQADWFHPDRALLEITPITLDHTKPSCSHRDTTVVAEMSGNLLAPPCDCGKTTCVYCLMMCYFCAGNVCENCVEEWVDMHGISVDPNNNPELRLVIPVCSDCTGDVQYPE